MMSSIDRSALLPFSAQQMYTLINDVEAYPDYMDGCVGAEVLYSDDKTMQARLDLAKAGLKYSFTTRNTLTAPEKIVLELVDGPFSHFSGQWTIQALNDNACKVSLSLQFTLTGKVLGLAAKALFSSLADTMVNAMVKRAHQQYQ